LCAQISDCHIVEPGEKAAGVVDTAPFLRAAVAQLNSLDPAPDLVLASGDLVNDGRPHQYAHLADLLVPLRAPLYLMPGNHDDRRALRAAFPDHTYLGGGPTVDYVVEGPVRLIALDSTIPGAPGGRLTHRQLHWLDDVLCAEPDVPAVVAMHHPPFATGIGHMDQMALDAGPAEQLATVVRRHPQVERVVAGHLHRSISRRWAGTVAATVPGVAHAVALDLRPGGAAAWNLEPPAISLYLWQPKLGLVAHQLTIGEFAGGRFGDD
jgi:3',5'-cyclic AMP phosphodiesterase CpdA